MNKLKGSSSAVRMKHLFIVFAVAFFAVLPVRAYQLIVSVDFKTGFFAEGDITVPILYGIVAVAVILLLVLSFLCKGVPKPELSAGKNPVLGIASLVGAAGMVTDAVNVENMLVPMVGDTQLILYNNLSDSSGIFAGLRLVFAVISVIWFLMSGISHLSGNGSYKKMPLLALAPLGWSLCSLVSKLVEPVSFLKVSELFFEVAFFVFVSLFLFTFARISTGTFTENSMWGIFGYGLPAILFGTTVTIPRLVVYFLGLEPVKGNEFSFAHLAVTIFMTAAVAASLGFGFTGKKKEIQRVEEIELPDDDEVVVKSTVSVSVVEDFADGLPAEGVTVQEVSESEITAAIESLLGKRLTVEIDENDVKDLFDEEEEQTAELVEEEIDEPVEEVVEEEINEPVEEVVEEEIDEPVEIIVEEEIDEPVEEVVEEEIDEPVEDFVEEIIDEPVEEVVEEEIDEPVEEFVKEIIDEPVEEIVEEIIDEPVEEVVDEAIEPAPEVPAENESFVDFSEMLIDEDEDDEADEEKTLAESEYESVSVIAEVEENATPKETKKKKEKKKRFGKKTEAAEETDISLKPISLAELRSKKDSEQ